MENQIVAVGLVAGSPFEAVPFVSCFVISKNTYGNLVFNAGNVKQRLDLLPQFPPGPGTELQVLAQIALDDLQGDTLLLHLLELLTGQVATAPGLHPGHDSGQTLITEFLHLTQDTGAEEDLFLAKEIKHEPARTTGRKIG